MTYGYYRAEIIGALSSVLIIWILTLWLLYEAIDRLIDPQSVNPKIMLLTSCLGLIFNLLMMKVLHGDYEHNHCGHDHNHNNNNE